MITGEVSQFDDQDPLMLAEDLENHGDGSHQLSQEDESHESDVITIQKKPSLSAYLARYWHSMHFITRLAWWGIKQDSMVDDLFEERTSTRLFWLSGAGIPLDEASKIRWANKIKNFIDSTGFILTDVGSLLMTALLLHDGMSYGLFPEERCGTSLPNILTGTATNQITWTNHFGSDVIHEAAYWTWLGVILIPPMVGLSSSFLRNKRLSILSDTEEITHLIEALLHNLDKESLTFKQAFLSLLPMSRLGRTLAQVKLMLLWDGRKDDDQHLLISLNFKTSLVNTLIELTESNYFLIRYQAMRLLTQVAASFHPENLDRFIENPFHKEGLAQLREIILTQLRKEPINEASTRQSLADLEAACAQPLSFEEMDVALLEDRQRGGMAGYFRWTLGDDSRPVTQLFWIPTLLLSAYKFYVVSRYFELMIKKLMDIAYYFHDKSTCENKGNYFRFLTQSERYECVACDWPFVSYQSSFTPQTCLENLLQRRMTPIKLGRYLQQLPSVRGISRVDLSQQDWSNWSVSDWEEFLLTLAPRMMSPLELFNVSGITEALSSASTEQQIQALAQLLSQINVTQFDMSHQRLTDESFLLLLDSLVYPSLNALYLTDTNMTDNSAIYLSELVANRGFNLSDLHLAANQLGDRGITEISQIVSNSSLQLLNLAQNLFSDLGLQKLGLGIQQSAIQSLDLSDQLFSVQGLRLFNEALKGNSTLSQLKLRNVGLTNDHLIALQNCIANLEVFDISANLLDGEAIQFVLNISKQTLKSLVVHNNDVDEKTSRLIAQVLPTTSLQHLDLSKNYLKAGFKELAKALPNSTLLSLICEDCDLQDKDVIALASVFSNTTRLQSLNLNKNQITDAALLDWLAELSENSLRELQLSDNEISSSNESAPLLAQDLTQLNLTLLDLSNNRLDKDFFNELAGLLPQSKLQQLSLSGNTLEATALKHFSEALVQLPCHHQDLNMLHLSRQEKRVFYPMKRNTRLNRLDIMNTNMDSATRRGFCRVASSLPDIHFLEQNVIKQLDWQTCELISSHKPRVELEQTSELTSNQTQSMRPAALVLSSPFLMSLLCGAGILCLIGLMYGTYRASRSAYRFFRPAPDLARSEPEENRADYLSRSSF